ncbi:winged helix-turn-helix transcriptional regulator [Corynebacterium cystitidis]|uniref:Transcriptional regulator, HxlR family n=1 Tax=Corynebacterium cystitidis DSM 20524 TaxID=1121357 RepID=A0A1H9R5J2_9CORY|nr:helix-turn-helix domain-containing protein [Corynebacterium cystitidis]WJY81543.1 putative HTH-type transcriptional regulator YybR [Corynebacterium cystitidis DSM 20524]SER67996.1 transcriptional regulator, HxlR family [Corynebacterium cystitidis DSM 20524]SNV86408.1 QorR DNA-binding transcription regulator [Corynebacterium cystitidis]
MKVSMGTDHQDAGAHPPRCPVETCLLVLNGKWKPLIMRELLSGKKRFGELHNGVRGVSQKVLTSNLKEMVVQGIVERTAYAEMPPRVEYELTELGQSLSTVIEAMWAWGENYQQSQAEDSKS